MAEHTPGPLDWTASAEPTQNNGFHLYLTDAGGRKIAALWGSSREKLANARLFGAAPELLEALSDLVRSLADADEDGLTEFAEPMCRARAAISRARGA